MGLAACGHLPGAFLLASGGSSAPDASLGGLPGAGHCPHVVTASACGPTAARSWPARRAPSRGWRRGEGGGLSLCARWALVFGRARGRDT